MMRQNRDLKKKAAALLAGVALAGSLVIATPTVASAATNLGGIDLSGYCKSIASSNKDMAYAQSGRNAWDWKCVTASGTWWTGYKWWSGAINVNAACVWKYGKGAYANTVNSTPWGWRCYR